MNSNFQFLCIEWPDVFDSAAKTESLTHPDPRASCFYARRTLELAVHWLYKFDPALKLPYQDNYSALLYEFARRAAAVEKLKTARRKSLAELDVLLASLQARAFQGQL